MLMSGLRSGTGGAGWREPDWDLRFDDLRYG
jgi:hypothetical protein